MCRWIKHSPDVRQGSASQQSMPHGRVHISCRLGALHVVPHGINVKRKAASLPSRILPLGEATRVLTNVKLSAPNVMPAGTQLEHHTLPRHPAELCLS